MALCVVPALLFGDGTALWVALAAAITIVTGVLLLLLPSKESDGIDKRKSYFTVTLMWVVLALFGTLPFLFTRSVGSFTDAFFESLSGLTSTGATIFPDVGSLPASLLLWRSMTQWLGGFGIIMLVLAVVPSLGMNKYSLYTAEVSSADNTGKTTTSMRAMVRQTLSIYCILTALFILFTLLPVSCLAAGRLSVDDGADLLSASEEAQLIENYSPITEYMDAAFVSTSHPSGSTSSFAERYAIEHYGNNPAVIFLIDMRNREIYIYANGAALKTISRADARAITDNIYKSATAGKYYECADRAFSQILAKCQGARLARPVKHITNALIAALVGILINYLLTVYSRRPRAQRIGLETREPGVSNWKVKYIILSSS